MEPNHNSQKGSIFYEIVEMAFESVPNLDPHVKKQVLFLIEKFLGPIIKKFEESRVPRLAIIGRTRSGKTTLLNAVFERNIGKVGHITSTTSTSYWVTYNDGLNDIAEFLDTRGVQEGTPPPNAPAITSLQSVLDSINEKTPDMFLFLEKAKEVNSAIKGDLDAFQKCLTAVYNKEKFYPVVLGIPSQCDELDPLGFWDNADRKFYSTFWDVPARDLPKESSDPDFEYRYDKLCNIRTSMAVWRKQLETINIIKQENSLKVIPTSANRRIRRDGSYDPDPRADFRWNIDTLKDIMLGELPEDSKIQFIRWARIRAEQKRYTRGIIAGTTLVAAAVGMLPTPPTFDLPFLLAIQILQIMLISFISGSLLTWQAAFEFLVGSGLQTGVGFGAREVFRAAAKFVGPLGWLVSGGIAGGASVLSGIIADSYFIDGKNITVEEAKKLKKYYE